MEDERKRGIPGERMLRITDEAGRSVPPELSSDERGRFLQCRSALLLISAGGLAIRFKGLNNPEGIAVLQERARELLALMDRLVPVNNTSEVLPPLQRVYDPAKIVRAGIPLGVQNPDAPGDALKIPPQAEIEIALKKSGHLAHHAVAVVSVYETLQGFGKTLVHTLALDVTDPHGYRFLSSMRNGGKYQFSYYAVSTLRLAQDDMLID